MLREFAASARTTVIEVVDLLLSSPSLSFFFVFSMLFGGSMLGSMVAKDASQTIKSILSEKDLLWIWKE